MNMIQAVIFDMDGLLVDSEHAGLDVMAACGRKQGVEMALEDIKKTLGSTYAFSIDLYSRLYPQLDPVQLFADFKNSMLELAAAGKIPLKKGAKELLHALKERNIPRAVGSSSPLPVVKLYLEKAGVLDEFQALVTGDLGLPSKPEPDMFLTAAEKLGIAPENCLVLEDSVNGVKAGRNAGMQVGMVPDVLPYKEELKPFCDHVLPDLSAVLPLLKA